MIKSKKQMFIVIGVFALVMLLSTVTYAFFNYTRTGVQNTIRVGRISFISRQTETISLTNLFPIDPTNTSDMNDPDKVGTLEIEIVGDTDYQNGIEYLISTVNSSISSNGKRVPISIDVTIEDLGTNSDNYFTARNSKNATIYKRLSGDSVVGDQQILVGYIKPNTTSGTAEGVNGKITIKAYLDENNILISDTYNNGETPTDNLGTPASLGEGKTVFTTAEWNALQSTGASFKVKVEANEGIWVEEPLTSYTQIIRNVDTETTINFANISSSSNGEGLYILPGTESDQYPIYYYRGAVTNNNVIFGDYCWQMVRTTDTGGIKMIYNGEATGNGTTCENTTAESRQLASTSAFNSQSQSVADVGYMKNTRYLYQSTAPTSGVYYGTSIEYGEYDTSNPGTNVYRLVDDGNGSVGTTLDADHHYSCNSVAATGTCTTIRYYYYVSGTTYRYINLIGGEEIEDAIYKMTGNGDAETKARNSSYVLNNTDSTVKTAIESWFRTNLTNEVDNTKRNYVNFLEDTVYCNDRSYQTTGSGAYTNSGWNPNGGSLRNYLYFGSGNRARNNWYSTTNVPTTACPNETDRFSVSSSVAHLNYPVGLLTADEIVMAGASGNSNISNNTYYLYTGNYYWYLSPTYFDGSYAYEFLVTSSGTLSHNYVGGSGGLRPVVSLKLGTEFETGGDGTGTNPYVVKYE